MSRKLLIFLGLLLGIYITWGRRKMLTWGATEGETKRPMPGDDLIPQPQIQATRAISIHAPKEEVWRWLAQMGRERTGFYGLDGLDNWNIPSITYIRQDLAPLEIGMTLDNGLKVLNFAPDVYLLAGGFDMPNDMGGWSDFTYLYWLDTLSENETRLVVRMRCTSEGALNLIYHSVVEIMDTLMTIAQLHGIQSRAEAVVEPPQGMPVPVSEAIP